MSENDNLHALYVRRIGQDIPFLCHWLKGFMLMHQKYFQRKAKNYLVSKGLYIESWSESVMNGWKADVLALFGLNLLLEMHTIVHLGNEKTWTMLAKQGKPHHEDLNHCDMHLAHVGRSLFVELVPRDILLQIVADMATSQSVVIGEIKTLTQDEVKAFEQVQKLGLGIGVGSKPTPSASAGSTMDQPWVERELVETAMVTVKTESSAKPTTKILTTSNEKCETFLFM